MKIKDFGPAPAPVTRAMKVRGHAFDHYKPESFPEELRALIPTFDKGAKFPPEVFETLCVSNTLSKRAITPTYLFGHKGSGKTLSAYNFGALTGRPVLKVMCSKATEVGDLISMPWLDADDDGHAVMTRILGAVAIALKYGCIVILDEADRLTPYQQGTIMGPLEAKIGSVYTDESGCQIPVREGAFVILTGNTNGSGDTTGLYPGTQILNSALLDRVLAVGVEYLDPDTETKVVSAQAGVDAGFAASIVKLAHKTRESVLSGTGSTVPLSTRSLVQWAKAAVAYSGFEPSTGAAISPTKKAIIAAWRASFYNSLPDSEDEAFYGEAFNGVLGFECRLAPTP